MSDYKKYLQSDNPLTNLISWFEEAKEKEENPTAFTLSTIGLDGYPNSRTLLVKDITQDGLTFFTNYNSLKGKEIEANENVSMTFYWHRCGRQVRIKGRIKKVDQEISKNYFQSRPFESQVASFISKQSEVVDSREELVSLYKNGLKEYKETGVPYPENWGGYLVEPCEVTFFVYGEFRLNDRFQFKKESGQWLENRLYP
ncbi:pyridoxamine 5'-phosphate oxidase [Bacteriovorax sp. Seq25_V]|uniref:pyridoxamine 5'-phosphate oxidase n=1 Tax=Bacteriovorax sp. Seq25_V TaxID=1201288 RepID=UPI00038A12DD|nr:pyridoxamine 5'-phosphate oxidase [Bacteriovorax sp. Seq25_V]EQC46605.1 pyridoxamine 5'-phosphate oxidase [Bacteriovorax sp. Seq25_V]